MTCKRLCTKRFTWKWFGGHNYDPWGWERNEGHYWKRRYNRMERRANRYEATEYAYYETDEIYLSYYKRNQVLRSNVNWKNW